MQPSVKKRFWTDVSVVANSGGFDVLLDEHVLRTPSKSRMIVPTKALAQAVATEWAAQVEAVDPTTMPMTRRVNTAIDKVVLQQADVAAMLSEYGGSDLCCYRAEFPTELAARQAAAWDPIIDWVAQKFEARLKITTGIMHLSQDPKHLAGFSGSVHALGPFQLTGFHDLVTHSGSLLIAFAAILEFEGPNDLWDRAQVDEIWQAEQWGADEDAEVVEAKKRQEFLDAFRFFGLVS
ncbi:MAG: chaperone required for assembly of F1-ATPase [Paracoccaceae bacterium]|jgi:chaperone required for assembly of F1-ATPase